MLETVEVGSLDSIVAFPLLELICPRPLLIRQSDYQRRPNTEMPEWLHSSGAAGRQSPSGRLVILEIFHHMIGSKHLHRIRNML